MSERQRNGNSLSRVFLSLPEAVDRKPSMRSLFPENWSDNGLLVAVAGTSDHFVAKDLRWIAGKN